LVQGGAGPALLGLSPGAGCTPAQQPGRAIAGRTPPLVPAGRLVEGAEGELPVAAPAGVTAGEEDIADKIRSRVAEATSKVVGGPVTGAPNKLEQQVPVDTSVA
jgi:hypothetical protein